MADRGSSKELNYEHLLEQDGAQLSVRDVWHCLRVFLHPSSKDWRWWWQYQHLDVFIKYTFPHAVLYLHKIFPTNFTLFRVCWLVWGSSWRLLSRSVNSLMCPLSRCWASSTEPSAACWKLWRPFRRRPSLSTFPRAPRCWQTLFLSPYPLIRTWRRLLRWADALTAHYKHCFLAF